MPDFRYSLQAVADAWKDCQGCDLGVRRHEVGGEFVFGEGAPRGIMFIGEGPGESEEVEGRPFIGRSGLVLRQVIDKLGLNGSCYITNLVSCRSCSQAYNSEGQPIMRRDRKSGKTFPLIQDEPPNPQQIATCLPRLHEEIYLVDPVLIVALGGEASKALSNERSFSILSERGKTKTISIPGAQPMASFTEKRQVWERKVRGQLVRPTTQNRVKYLMLPTLHPSYVLRRQADRSFKNPLDVFLDDMKLAARIYDRYLLETYGTETQQRNVTVNDIAED